MRQNRRPSSNWQPTLSLVAVNADVGAARAALYPSLSVSASAAASGGLTGGSGTLLTLAGSRVHTLFDGGALRGQVALNERRARGTRRSVSANAADEPAGST